MTLKKLTLKPGVNRENTRYFNENGWFVSQWVRFRQGTPEKIGGYARLSANTFIGVCRSLLNWVTLAGRNYLGIGTSKKYYIENGGAYYDITPYRTFDSSGTLTNPFTTNLTTPTSVLVTDTAHGLLPGSVVFFTGATSVGGIPASVLNARHVVATTPDLNTYTIVVSTPAVSVATGGGTVAYQYYSTTITLTNPFTTNLVNPTRVNVFHPSSGVAPGDYVTFSNASPVGGLTLNGTFTVTALVDTNNYVITSATPATSVATGGGTVYAQYEVPVGSDFQVPTDGWGTGAWGIGAWGIGSSLFVQMRVWFASNFGEDLVYAPRGRDLYYWDATTGTGVRGVAVKTLAGANNVPLFVNALIVSDISRFVLVFGTNEIFTNTLDPMLIRWADQESVVDWTPSPTSQAGSIRLSAGSEIVTRLQTRQEILVWTDSAIYSLQYVGPPVVWSPTLLSDNISIQGPNAAAVGAGVVYWMGNGKFYSYDGRVQTLRCDLRQFIFNDFNFDQHLQVCAGSNEAFNEIWWFYPSANSLVPDKYVVYNYLEDIWYYGTLTRFVWIDRNTREYPMAASADKIIYHEDGLDDQSTEFVLPINSFIESTEFDIDDGDRFGFIYRVLPDMNFSGSTNPAPAVTMTFYPMVNSGSGFGTSIGGSDFAAVVRTVAVPVEEFTGQVYVRIRGRQIVMRVESAQVGVAWQLGAPRIDIKTDGRRGT